MRRGAPSCLAEAMQEAPKAASARFRSGFLQLAKLRRSRKSLTGTNPGLHNLQVSLVKNAHQKLPTLQRDSSEPWPHGLSTDAAIFAPTR